ncbi:hypothetical protein [Chamaesiphon sp. OTE_75_metabat_556]|jgi:hypothetical protein|uniref:hypothetical protein n=1 Tax=Chamaesiphon sp. OTE_75_metabat_556 TaxID=2964692 RepID=UPI00286B77D4|nr:hypothetical protein [Chamaesiphon sp. OTE_75_metabat_556]
MRLTPASGAGPDISEGKKMRALTATNAKRNTSKIRNGATFWRKKVIMNFKIDRVKNSGSGEEIIKSDW